MRLVVLLLLVLGSSSPGVAADSELLKNLGFMVAVREDCGKLGYRYSRDMQKTISTLEALVNSNAELVFGAAEGMVQWNGMTTHPASEGSGLTYREYRAACIIVSSIGFKEGVLLKPKKEIPPRAKGLPKLGTVAASSPKKIVFVEDKIFGGDDLVGEHSLKLTEINRSEYGENWPFKQETAMLACANDTGLVSQLVATDGAVYALNGSTLGLVYRMYVITDDGEHVRVRKDLQESLPEDGRGEISELIGRGLDVCN